jgi:hypothetical protein
VSRWLTSEQSAISCYFDRHPSVCQLFLEAVLCVTGRESYVTPVTTPADVAVNGLPLVTGFHKVTTLKSSAVHEIHEAIPHSTTKYAIKYRGPDPLVTTNKYLDAYLQTRVRAECVKHGGRGD